ncbi:GNAT family N-acetyltransferase [Devosia sp. 1635]|uniref:GNAT family N-acetyltransferase n=1 Tax=Devosia sp. 1635 TaxID=2726066 RepID=UPI001567C075|nr:GNAT family N-acetyltransferase [Devosia sp. 1635]
MSMLALTARFATFARVHYATDEDVGAPWALSDNLPGERGGQRPIWTTLVRAKGAYVLVATECQLIVGAVVASLNHRNQAVCISWLGVTPAARGRGVGHLLLKTIVDRMVVEGARTVSVALPADHQDLKHLLLGHGFIEVRPGTFRLPIHGHLI